MSGTVCLRLCIWGCVSGAVCLGVGLILGNFVTNLIIIRGFQQQHVIALTEPLSSARKALQTEVVMVI